MAEEIGIADSKTIGRWERGVAFPSAYFLQRLCTLFGMQAEDLGLYHEESALACIPRQPLTRQNNVIFLPAPSLYDPDLPSPLSETGGLVGQDELFEQIKQRLCAGKNPALSALNGLPGVGKTAFAIELAYDREIRRHFSDGVLWAGLGPRPDVLEQMRRWGSLTGLTPAEMANVTNVEALARTIHTAIGERRMLLVIDDAWKIEHALAFKVGGPHCGYLLTTRMPPVALLFGGESAITVRELGEEGGLRLLEHYAADIVSSEPDTARALVQSVGGLPLALILMGKYLQSQVYCGQPRRLQAALERLRHVEARLQLAEQQAPLERHVGLPEGAPLSLESVIEINNRELDETAQHVLAMLSTFPAKPSSFSEEAALAVSAAPVETLDALIDAGLLESAGPGRYTLHRTIADYANNRLCDTGAVERMVEYFISYVEMHATDCASLEQETSNVLAALQMACKLGMNSALIRGAIAFSPFLRARGLYGLAETHLKRAEQVARALGDTASLSRMLYHLII